VPQHVIAARGPHPSRFSNVHLDIGEVPFAYSDLGHQPGHTGTTRAHMAANSAGRTRPQAALKLARLVSFLLEKSPDAMLDAVLACARDGDPRWTLVFEAGLARLIAHSQQLQERFFRGLVGKEPATCGAPIVDAYLGTLTRDQLSTFLNPAKMKLKAHPVRQVLRGAADTTGSFEVYCSVLEVFIRRGLDGVLLADVVDRAEADFAVACVQCNRKFLQLVVPKLPGIPDSLLIAVVRKRNSERGIKYLVDNCAVPIDRLTDPKVICHASPPTWNFIIAVEGRANRIPHRTSSRK
jgi:hypothetical protein